MHGHQMPKNVLIACGLITLALGLLALLEAMGTVTILGANGLPWIYILVILMGLGKLERAFLCPEYKKK